MLKSKWQWVMLALAILAVWYVIHSNCTGCQARWALMKSKWNGDFPLPEGSVSADDQS